jgi:hypothetical protein
MAGKPVRSRIGTFSRAAAVRKVDGRTVEARIIGDTIRDLTEHLGGEARVTAPQKILIHASAVLVLRLRCALDRYAHGDDPESLDRHVVALQNGLRANLLALGLQRPQEQTLGLGALLIAEAQAAKRAG